MQDISKSLKALLVYLSQEDADYLISGKLEYGMKRVPKLGFMYLASVLKKKDIDTVIKDQSLKTFTLGMLLDELQKENYLFVGFYSATALKQKLIHYIKEIKKTIPHIPILVGGPGFYSAKDYLDAGGDIVCKGEGEKTILEIVEYLYKKRPIASVKGISYKFDSRILDTPPQALIENLDELPFPRRKKDKSLTDYYDFHIFNMRTPYTTMITSRGCPYVCTYCTSTNVWGNRIRLRSPENVIGEIAYCVEELGIRYIGFRDDLFGFNYEWLNDFCNLLIEKRYNVLWSCMVHPFSFRKGRKETLRLLKKASCDLLIFGLQSAHPQILKNIRRNPSEPEELSKTIKLAKSLGISTVAEFIFGLPAETSETINTSINYVLRIKPHYTQFNALSVLEGSQIERDFLNKDICQFSDDEIRKLCSYASRKFYGNPLVLLQDLIHILRKNPLWFFRIARYFLYLFKYLGFYKYRYSTKKEKYESS
ncbi:MAG: radical SAM protein [Candidatus Omnitrophica bacterium]|nr:radical SAM protein [Candidatus Omnitrophota bacterium]